MFFFTFLTSRIILWITDLLLTLVKANNMNRQLLNSIGLFFLTISSAVGAETQVVPSPSGSSDTQASCDKCKKERSDESRCNNDKDDCCKRGKVIVITIN